MSLTQIPHPNVGHGDAPDQMQTTGHQDPLWAASRRGAIIATLGGDCRPMSPTVEGASAPET